MSDAGIEESAADTGVIMEAMEKVEGWIGKGP